MLLGPFPSLALGGPWPHRLEQLGSIPGSLAATTGHYQMDRGAQPKTVDRYIVASGLASSGFSSLDSSNPVIAVESGSDP